MIALGAIVVIAGINNSSDLPDPSFAHLWIRAGSFRSASAACSSRWSS